VPTGDVALRAAVLAFALELFACDSSAASTPQFEAAQYSDAANGTNWPAYGRTYDESHYSPLDQINAGNVGRLGLKWALDITAPGGTVGAPLAVDGIIYFPVGHSIIHAANADTGIAVDHDRRSARWPGRSCRLGWGARGIAYCGTERSSPALRTVVSSRSTRAP
jgi:quinohemoprotein ethanol dehydrogenase